MHSELIANAKPHAFVTKKENYRVVPGEVADRVSNNREWIPPI
jgi:hypothetical protein